MKIQSNTILSVMSANEKPSVDGRNIYYNLAIMQDGEVANVSCTEEVFNDVRSFLEPNMIKTFRFRMVTDLTYKSVKLTALLPDSDSSSCVGGGKCSDEVVTAETSTEAPADNKTGNKADNKATTK